MKDEKTEEETSSAANPTILTNPAQQNEIDELSAWEKVQRKPRPSTGKTGRKYTTSESTATPIDELAFQFDEEIGLPCRQRNYSSSRYSL